MLLGEVWEDGTNKIAYGQRRRYLLGRETHGLMSYPFRKAAMDWLLGGDAAAFRGSMETLRENYPTPRLLQCHELSGHSRYAPDPDPSGRRAHTGEQDGTGSSPAYPGRI